jgi:hypothetical protein
MKEYEDIIAKKKHGYSSFGEYQTALIEGLRSTEDVESFKRLYDFMNEVFALSTSHPTSK